MPNIAYVGHEKRGAGTMKDMGNTDWCDLGKFYEVWRNGDMLRRFKDNKQALEYAIKNSKMHPTWTLTIYEVTPTRAKGKTWLPNASGTV